MSENKTPLGITDVVLRDAHQSLLATRMRIDDMLPIAEKLDQVAFKAISRSRPIMSVTLNKATFLAIS